MKTPKILFKYSWIYDQNWKEWIKNYKTKNLKYPSTKKVLNYTVKVEKIWRNYEKNILSELSRITGLKWKEDFIYCYVVGNCRPFSNPLTMPVYNDKGYFVDTLIHELIHQLFTQEGNMKQTTEAWKYINRKYRNETVRTRTHIPLHAILSYIYIIFFDEKRLKRDIISKSFFYDYKRAWQIVQQEGYQNIIHEFIKRIK